MYNAIRLESGSIRYLSEALRHKETDLYMILTAYLDESGTHSQSPVLIMAGYLGNKDQWNDFEEAYNKLRQKFGFRVFHAKDFRATHGEFISWSREKKADLLKAFYLITEQHLEVGFATVLEKQDYNSVYRPRGEKLKKIQLDTAYGMCFRESLSFLVGYAAKHFDERPTVNIVLETGHTHVGDCYRIFHSIKTSNPELFGSFTLETKASCAVVHAADFLAYTSFLREESINAEIVQDQVAQLSDKTWRVGINPNSLSERKAQLFETGKAKH